MDPTAALAEARPEVLWLDLGDRPERRDPLGGDATADLVVVGAGFTGLWAALLAAQELSLDVVVIDSGSVGGQASGRNGGFLSSSLTHGVDNGLARFGADHERIVTAARTNFAEMTAAIEKLPLDAHLERNGILGVATSEWQIPGVLATADLLADAGEEVEVLSQDTLTDELRSPTFRAGYWQKSGEALVDPARLSWGLAAACDAAGARVFEDTTLLGLERRGAGMAVRTDRGTLRCGSVILATGAFPSPLSAINRRVVPVYDYALATEPLSNDQLRSIGWRHRQGVSDSANQFHYYRLTADDRILWGGYDAVFHNWGRISDRFEQRAETHRKLARHFFDTFPQLEGLRFTHRWGGVIDTSTRFSVGFGTAFDGRVAYAVGYTGLGVGASRFGARVCVDLLHRPESELLGLSLVRKGLLPFPPEPLRTIGIQLTRRALARADADEGRRGPWLRLLDALGLGFDS